MTLSAAQSVYGGHPATQFEVGDIVSCDWNSDGHVTMHRIMRKLTGQKRSQTGTLFIVSPPVTRARFAGQLIDAAWLFKDGLEAEEFL